MIKLFDYRKRIDKILTSYQSYKRKKDGLDDDIPFINRIYEIYTYENAVQFFTIERPSDKRVKKLLVKNNLSSKGHLITLMFLDVNDKAIRNNENIIMGRQLIALNIDNELLEMIGSKKGLVIE